MLCVLNSVTVQKYGQFVANICPKENVLILP